MKKISLLIFAFVALLSAYQIGDEIPNLEFETMKWDENNNISTEKVQLYSILDSGKPVIIYFFDITFS
ncbi:MAG: hypothetical protein JXR48_14680 [Candidatus Delongbacteria bacterium]|nr:hypothetical protein [Candidatus Delongbacteria bacterium]MBN2836202.1 hypothetical protein [Candidatus Delongbacteria bacterium]